LNASTVPLDNRFINKAHHASFEETPMTVLQKTLLTLALLASAAAHAQNTQWQVQISNQPQPQPPVAVPVPQNTYAIQQAQQAAIQQAAIQQAVASVEGVQAQQQARILWTAQRGYINEPEYRRLTQMQANIEYNRRIAYADGFFNTLEQQFVFGQLNVLSAEIDTLMLNGNFAHPYFVQFGSPIPVWVPNNGWMNGRYEIRADSHHSRAYRPAPQPPVIQSPPQAVPQGQPRHRNHLRDLLDPLGVFR
jgi:hypothetical protein